jgi:hypothetical protein
MLIDIIARLVLASCALTHCLIARLAFNDSAFASALLLGGLAIIFAGWAIAPARKA